MNSQKQNRHSLMAKGIMVLLALLVLVFIFTMAWFISQDHPAIANGLSVSTKSSVDFDVAIGFSSPDTGGNYYVTDFASAETFDFEDLTIPVTVNIGNNTTITNPISETIEHFNLLSSFKPIDLTGNGVRLYRPSMMPKNASIRYDDSTVSYDITENKQYISFDLYVRSKSSDMHVSLDTQSYLTGACEVDDVPIVTLTDEIADGDVIVGRDTHNGANLKENTTYRKSTYGNFSEDSVVGAVRIAFTQYKQYENNLASYFTCPEKKLTYDAGDYQLDASTLKLWIPRPDLYLQDKPVESTDPWVLVTKADDNDAFQDNVTFYDNVMRTVYTGSSSGTISYENAAKLHKFYDDTKIAQFTAGQAASRFSSVNAITDLATQDTSIVRLDSNMTATVGSDSVYYGKCRVNLWIEGCDAEARRAIDGGSFLFGFDLKGEIGDNE